MPSSQEEPVVKPDRASEQRGDDDIAIGVKDLERTTADRRRIYIGLRVKLLMVIAVALVWAGLSVWVSMPWIDQLSHAVTLPGAIALIGGIAIIPGYLNANLLASVLLDRPPPLRYDLVFPELTIIIACFNEESTIEETIDYVLEQDYSAVLPLNIGLSAVMYHLSRRSFHEVGLKVRQNRLGFLGYLLTYQLFMSPVSVAGYAQELFGARRRW